MSDSPFKTFIELVSFDHADEEVRVQKRRVQKELQALQTAQESLQLELEKAKQVCVAAQKEVARHELTAADLTQQETEKKRRLESVAGHKEYKSLKTELDHIRHEHNELETQLLQAWAGVDTAAKQYDQKKNGITAQLQELDNKRDELNQQQQKIAQMLEAREPERAEKERMVPAEWLEKYAAMRSRVDDPVVPVARGHCSSCYYKVSDQDLLTLARNKLLQCKDCYRFLYLPDRV